MSRNYVASMYASKLPCGAESESVWTLYGTRIDDRHNLIIGKKEKEHKFHTRYVRIVV